MNNILYWLGILAGIYLIGKVLLWMLDVYFLHKEKLRNKPQTISNEIVYELEKMRKELEKRDKEFTLLLDYFKIVIVKGEEFKIIKK